METTLSKDKPKRNVKLRKTEYHPKLQQTLDNLYAKSKEGQKFYSLMPLITSASNIKLAIRNIKSNKGSKTKGTNKTVIQDILDKPIEEVISYVRKRFEYYKPQSVRRVYIPKSNGKERPLGIPTIEERLLQQCILQVIEPIAEAKFIKHSYGFRPHRTFYSVTTRWGEISSQLDWKIRRFRYNRLRHLTTTKAIVRNGKTVSGKSKTKRSKLYVNDVQLLKVTDIKHTDYVYFNSKIGKYTEEGRNLVHGKLVTDITPLFQYMEDNPKYKGTTEYNINRVAALSQQQGKCPIIGNQLMIGYFAVHHRVPLKMNGTDETSNLVVLESRAHKMVHSTDNEVLRNLYNQIKEVHGDRIKLRSLVTKLNKYRTLAGIERIDTKIFRGL